MFDASNRFRLSRVNQSVHVYTCVLCRLLCFLQSAGGFDVFQDLSDISIQRLIHKDSCQEHSGSTQCTRTGCFL